MKRRDTGRKACYEAEGALGPQPQEDWRDLMALARAVVADPVVRSAYPKLVARTLKLKPVMKFRGCSVAHYEPSYHRICLFFGGRDRLTLLHEMAHACLPGEGHADAWRQAYILLVWRHMGEEMGRRVTASFINHGAIRPSGEIVEPSLI